VSVISTNLIGNAKRIYLIGIGGVGMSGLARILKRQGYEVAGFDSKESATTHSLREHGIQVWTDKSKSSIADADLVIYSSAISASDPEMITAKRLGIKVHHRAEILATLLNFAPTSVGIAGTHGKTTTTSMTSFVLSELGQKPTCLVGGDVLNWGTNAILGRDDLWVAEIDESDRSHEFYALSYAVLTNLEQDHIENYKDLADLKGSFERFAGNVKNPGLIVYSAEDALLAEIVKNSGKPSVSVGFSPSFDFSADSIIMNNFGSEFDLLEAGFFVARVKLGIPGRHNIANALCTLALLSQMGYDLEEICRALSGFRGAKRRLESKGEYHQVMVIDDYAHHPTEVRASIRALRAMGKKVTIVFQPHRYTRTAYFFKDFALALAEADQVILTDIYSAGEQNPGNVHARLIQEQLLGLGHPEAQIVPRERIIAHLQTLANLQGVVAFVGAGNIGEVADEFACRLKNFATA
jgi:UDP-N-acetylmuramate--alanine ligase